MRRSWPKREASRAGAVAVGLGLLPLCVFPGAAAAAAFPGAAAAAAFPGAAAAPVSLSAASGTWTIQPSPNQPGATSSQLDAVSCVSNGPCTAVGTYFTGTGTPRHQFALALRRSGTTWVLEPTPHLNGVGYSLFNGVSCTSASSCIAVGYTVSSLSTNPSVRALAERWNGTSWAVVSPPVTAGPHPWAELNAVSCPGPASCVAVGGYIQNLNTGQEQPLAEGWNGKSWTQLNAPNPHAQNGSALTSVACVAASACEAEGDYDYFDANQSIFAYAFNGTSWAAQKQVNPAGLQYNSDNSISCTSATACTSAGSWDGAAPLGLAERWNGTAWRRQPVPTPPTAVTDMLAGVSCAAATACTAVGASAASPNGYPTSTMAMTWNGTSWQLATTPTPAGDGRLTSVSCTTPTACVAVGSAGTSTLVEASSG